MATPATKGCPAAVLTEEIEKNKGQFCKWECGTFIQFRAKDCIGAFRSRVRSHQSTGCKKRNAAPSSSPLPLSSSPPLLVSTPNALPLLLSTSSTLSISSPASSLSYAASLSLSSAAPSMSCAPPFPASSSLANTLSLSPAISLSLSSSSSSATATFLPSSYLSSSSASSTLQRVLDTLKPDCGEPLQPLIANKIASVTDFVSTAAMFSAFAAAQEPIVALCPAMHIQMNQDEEMTFFCNSSSAESPLIESCTIIREPRRPFRCFTSSELQRAWRLPYAEGGVHLYDSDIWTSLLDRFDWHEFDETNVLCGTPEARRIMARGAVMSSVGAFTVSHCDAFSTVNHALCGEKIWLVGDHEEWTQAGFFCDTCMRGTRDVFRLERFLQLPSSRILVVSPHHTLFLPRRFVHRVYTTDTYLGVGMFYVFTGSVGTTLRQWISHPPRDYDVSFYRNLFSAIVANCHRNPKWAAEILSQMQWVLIPSNFIGRRLLQLLMKDLREIPTRPSTNCDADEKDRSESKNHTQF